MAELHHSMDSRWSGAGCLLGGDSSIPFTVLLRLGPHVPLWAFVFVVIELAHKVSEGTVPIQIPTLPAPFACTMDSGTRQMASNTDIFASFIGTQSRYKDANFGGSHNAPQSGWA